MGKKEFISYEAIRKLKLGVDKFDHEHALHGLLHAMQDVREIRRQHTYYPAQRTELDFTKYGVWIYPNENWSEPIFYHTGFGIDHYSTCIKGFTTTIDPSSRDAVRLYRNCVLPKQLWLPDSAKHLASQWDVFGLEDLVAVDNAMDLVSDSAILVFTSYGTILLRMPPKRGDLKGTSERTHLTIETQFASTLAGYVPAPGKKGFSPQYNKAREAAKSKAKLTVKEYEQKLAVHCLEFNHAPHPRLEKSRIYTWRDGQENHPIILPTGELQLRATFALTFVATLTREGVQVLELMYNSPELHFAYRVYSGKVFVKLNPDDIRAVIVIFPDTKDHIEATLTTFTIDFPVTIEIFRVVRQRLAAQAPDGDWTKGIDFAFPAELEKLQNGSDRTPGLSIRTDAQAATHSAAILVSQPKPEAPQQDLDSLLGGSLLDIE